MKYREIKTSIGNFCTTRLMFDGQYKLELLFSDE